MYGNAYSQTTGTALFIDEFGRDLNSMVGCGVDLVLI